VEVVVHRGRFFPDLGVLDTYVIIAVNVRQFYTIGSSAHVLYKQIWSGAGIQDVFGKIDSHNLLEVVSQGLLEELQLMVISVFVLLNLRLPFHIEVSYAISQFMLF